MSCRLLDWDSAFFGLRMARLEPLCVDTQQVAQALHWCQQQGVACLYFLADPGDRATVLAVEAAGFHSVDIRITYELRLPISEPEPSAERLFLGADDLALHIRPARETDLPALEDIAGASHHDTRFYFDARFARDTVDSLYRTWIRQSSNNPHGTVLVLAEQDETPLGYLSCERTPGQTTGQIGLVGVDARARGKGGGTALVQAALRWFHMQGIEVVTVVTQGRNLHAQRLYQKAGFVTQSLYLWYHRWFTK